MASTRRAYAGAAATVCAVALSAVASVATGTPRQPVAATAPRVVTAHAGACPAGQTPADDLLSATRTDVACRPLGAPESAADLATLRSELAARQAAPYSTVAPGAYGAALASKNGLARTAVPGSAGQWRQPGAPPLCGAASTAAGGPCPPPSADNGNYNGVGSLGHVQDAGRITAIASDPANLQRYFAAAAAGGVYETVNGGGAWRSIGDGLPTQVIGALAYDPATHTLLAGSGDNSFGGSGIGGHGLFLSADDGSSWQTAGGIPDLALTFRVVVSPADGTGMTVYAATSKGLFRSTDGGHSFVNEALPTSPAGYAPNCAGDTTTPTCFFASIVTDVVVRPTGAVMAAVGWRAGQRHDKNPDGTDNTTCSLNGSPTACLQAPQNGIYISATGLPTSFTYSPGTGFASKTVDGRTALAIAHGAGQNTGAVFALVEDAQKFNGCPEVLDQSPPACNGTVTGLGLATVLDGLYASYDFGATWTKVMDSTELVYPGTGSALFGQAAYNPGVQAWYNLNVDVDPTATDATGNPKRLIFGLEEVWENNLNYPGVNPLTTSYHLQPQMPGNEPWRVIGRYWNACGAVNAPACNPDLHNNPIPGTTTHPDQHASLFVPDASGGGVTLLVGNDGGMYSQHVGAAADFDNGNWGDGIDIGLDELQPYDANMARDGTVVSGLQDNGEMKITPDGHEYIVFGGDGFFSTIDQRPNGPAPTGASNKVGSNNIIEEYTYGQTSQSFDGGNSWFGTTPTNCGSSSTSLFSTPIEQDPTGVYPGGHQLVGCQQIAETTDAYTVSCSDPSCSTVINTQGYTNVFDLSTLTNTTPNPAHNIPSAIGTRGDYDYVGFCGYCDVVTQGVPFYSGLVTNVGGVTPPKANTSAGWHQAAAVCGNCQTPDGLLPNRYITSVQVDPTDATGRTVYVTMGGYGRRWIPPGALGDNTSNVGVGHVFVSHDAGATFSNISGNLPDVAANWTLVHDGNLIVATDLGAFISPVPGPGGAIGAGVLGTNLPTAPVFTIRESPACPNTLLASTYGRSDWLYTFANETCSVTAFAGSGSGGTGTGTPAGPPTFNGPGPGSGGGTSATSNAAAAAGHAPGYWMDATDGGIFPFGGAGGYGSTGNIHLNKPMVGMASTPDAGGYWLVAADGGIFPFGNAGGYGSTGNIHLNKPVVGMASTPDGKGYWLVASDGGIFPFGDAGGYGSTGNIHLNKPIVGMTATADGKGYWLVATDGGIFPFGDAVGYGSTGNIHLNQPIVGMASTRSGRGYWLVATDGGIFPFGDAPGYGSTGNIRLNKPVVGMAPTRDGKGYWLDASDGGIFPFGDAPGYGSLGNVHLNQPIVGMAAS